MKRKKRILRNIIILLILIILPMQFYYINPLKAHEASEKGIHYGPSRVIHVEDYELGKYYLCKYDRWFSCDSIKRVWGIFYRFGSQVTGEEINKEEPVNYSWCYSQGYYRFYGVVNDEEITSIELVFHDGSGLVLRQDDLYEDMFLFHGKKEWSTYFTLNGYSNTGELRYHYKSGF